MIRVAAHPIRARLRSVNLVTILAITAVLAVAAVMFTTVATLQR